MGTKGEARTGVAREAADATASRLASLGEVTVEGMFGGFGLFHDGVMFGLVDSAGEVHLRVDPSTRPRYEAAGGRAHGRMPYASVPGAVLSDDATLRTWATEALATARAARRR